MHAAASQPRKPAPEKSIILPDTEAIQLGGYESEDDSPVSTRTRRRPNPVLEKSVILPDREAQAVHLGASNIDDGSPISTRSRRRKTSNLDLSIETISDEEARPTRRLRRNSFVDSKHDEEVLEKASSQDQLSPSLLPSLFQSLILAKVPTLLPIPPLPLSASQTIRACAILPATWRFSRLSLPERF